MDIKEFNALLDDYELTLNDEGKNTIWLNSNMNKLEQWLQFSISDFNKIHKRVADLITKTEINFFLNSNEDSILPVYKRLVLLMLKYKARSRKSWIIDYLYYIENDSFDYYKYFLLDKIRSARTVQELKNKDSEIAKYINEGKDICDVVTFKEFKPIILEYFDIIFSDIRYSFLRDDEKIRKNEYFFEHSLLKPYYWDFNLKFSDFYIQTLVEDQNKSNEDIDTENENILNGVDAKTSDVVDNPVIIEPVSSTIDRSKYAIWLVFWSPKSVKDFHRWCKKDSTIELFNRLWINEDQFDVLNEEYETQQRMDIASKLYWSIDFVIVFELDHKTQFIDNVVTNTEFQHRITINDVPWQHFSIKRAKDLLESAIIRYESAII